MLKDRVIGDGQPVFIIAEAGVNHNGDISIAHKLIDAAASAGADAVKFQTFITEENISPDTPLAGHHISNVGLNISHFNLIKKLELPLDSFQELKEHCEEKGIIFISTPYDIVAANTLIKIKTEIIKVASSEMMNYPLLDVIGKSHIPVIVSTGMSCWDEIVDAVNFLGFYHSNICILKCTSNYPASPEGINLRGILKLRKAFPRYQVGFSDHSEGCEISLAALGFGVSIIERHFTLDKNSWGPDHRASLEPVEFKRFVEAVRKAEKALGSKDWEMQQEELSQRKTMQKGVYAKREIKKGSCVTADDVKFLRPTGKMTPKKFFLCYKNKIIYSDVKPNTELTPEHFINTN